MQTDGDWAAQLAVLKGLTSSTGVIHDAQRLNLKMWGAVAFEYVGKGKWEASVNIEKKTIVYHLNTTKKTKRPKKLPLLIAALDRSVRWLLGDSWKLRIEENDKLLYESMIPNVKPRTNRASKKRLK